MEEKMYKISATQLKNFFNNFLEQYFADKETAVVLDEIIIKEEKDGVYFEWKFTEITKLNNK